MKPAVLLLSSGLDSAANLVLHSAEPRDDFKVALAMTINYGQRGAARELRQAAVLTRHFEIEHIVFDLSTFSQLVGNSSALIGTQQMPQLQRHTLDDAAITQKSAAAVWVPNRNAVLLSLAAALAEARGIEGVAVGFNAEEAVTFPDNTSAFMAAVTHTLAFSTTNQVAVLSHTASLTKAEIVAKLDALDFPFELIWSCYEAGERHCGRCESCLRLRRALDRGISDRERRHRAVTALFDAAALESRE